MSVPYSEKTKDGQMFYEYHEEDVQDPVMDALLRQSYRMFTVSFARNIAETFLCLIRLILVNESSCCIDELIIPTTPV